MGKNLTDLKEEHDNTSGSAEIFKNPPNLSQELQLKIYNVSGKKPSTARRKIAKNGVDGKKFKRI